MSVPFERHPTIDSVYEVAHFLQTDLEKGLTSVQVSELSNQYPRNELDVGGALPWYTIFMRQLFNAMILVRTCPYHITLMLTNSILTRYCCLPLLFRSRFVTGLKEECWLVSYSSMSRLDFSKSIKRRRRWMHSDPCHHHLQLSFVMANLRSFPSKFHHHIRTYVPAADIDSPEVVPGDIVILKMGDTVPADLRLFEVMNLECDEKIMTGESLPVAKVVENNIVDPETGKLADSIDHIGIADRINLAFASTIVRKGRARGIVIATGMTTEVGKIALASTKKTRKPGRSMNARKYGIDQVFIGGLKRAWDFAGKFLGLTEGTPLQRKLAQLAYYLFFCAIGLAIIVFAVHRFVIPNEVIIYAISTGIAIIPESLVAVLTITMVQATRVMRKSNVVVR